MNWKHYATIAGIVAAAVALWYVMLPDQKQVGDWQPAKEAPQVAAVPKTTISPPKVDVYTEPAKKRLDLPAAVQQDPHAHVVAATRVPADEHPETVTTVIDDQTGQTETLVRREPLPWIAAEQRGEIGVGFGLKNGQKIFHLFAREDLVQIKSVHLGGGLHWFTDNTNMIELTATYKW